MKRHDLIEEIGLEKENIHNALMDIKRAQLELSSSMVSPTIIAGAASYIAQCYGGMESILKRLAKNSNISLPSSGEWHIELLKSFKKTHNNPNGILDENLFSRLSLMRKFRHVVVHGYGFKFNLEMVTTVLNDVPTIVNDFVSTINSYIDHLQ